MDCAGKSAGTNDLMVEEKIWEPCYTIFNLRD